MMPTESRTNKAAPRKRTTTPLDARRSPRQRAAVARRTAPAADAQQAMPTSPTVVEDLATTAVRPDPKNIRQHVGDITELTESIRQQGVLEPLIVTKHGKGWMIVCGERRYRAAKEAGCPTVPCIIREYAPQARLEAQLTENLQRSDLTPLEEARAYNRMLDYVTQRQLADRVNRSQSHISKRMSLLNLPEKLHRQIDEGELELGDALELAKLTKLDDGTKLVDEALALKRRSSYYSWPEIVEHVKETAEGRRKKAAAIAQLEAEGVKILPWPRSGWYAAKAKPIKSKTPASSRYYYVAVSVPIAAVKAGGHLAATVNDDGEVLYLCTDPKLYEKKQAGASSKTSTEVGARAQAMEAEAKAERSRKLEEGKQRRRAFADRLPYLRKVVNNGWGNDPEHGALAGIVSMQLTVATGQVHDLRIACDILDLDVDLAKGHYGVEAEAIRERAVISPTTVGAALGLATIERQLRDGSGPWNKIDKIQRRNFYALLADVGYEPVTPWELKLVADVRADARRAAS